MDHGFGEPNNMNMKMSRTGIIASALPSVLMLLLFYSLAIHMRYSLGAWPQPIDNAGFPPALSAHGHWASKYCSSLLLISIVVLPVGILVCLLVARWKRVVRYFALYALLYSVSWGLMLLAPPPFLNWWWD